MVLNSGEKLKGLCKSHNSCILPAGCSTEEKNHQNGRLSIKSKTPYMNLKFLLIVLLWQNKGVSQVKKLNAESAVQQITVFSSGARLERVAFVTLQAGRTEISFPGLSNQLDQQTVQLKADANIVLLSVQCTKDYLSVRKIEQDEKYLIEQSNLYKDKLGQDTRLLEVYKNEETMLIKNQSIGGQSGVKASDLKESLDLQRQRLTEVFEKQLEIQNRIRNDQQNFERNKMQLAEISKKRDSVSYIVTALVESNVNRTVNFQLLYNIKDAGWFPTYDVRVNDVAKPLHIMMNANIFQRSGETWKNVSLLLSTGNPNDNATPSLLQPWLLDYPDHSVSIYGQGSQGIISGRITDNNNQPVSGATVTVRGTNISTLSDVNGFFKILNNTTSNAIVVTSIGFSSKVIALKPGYISIALERAANSLNEVVVAGYSTSSMPGTSADDISERRMKKTESIQTVTVATQYQPTTTVFRMDDRYTLETDGKTTTVGIREFEVPAVYDYYSAPKIDPSSFLTAKIINWQEYDMQSGEVSLYFEGTYLGKTYIDLATVNDTLSLSLGKDNAVKVSRRLIKEYSSKKFIGSNRTDTKEYELIVRNSKPVPVNIRILDQVPVSVTKEINVDDINMPDAELNKESGIATWVLNLLPGQERKLKLGYSVKYPKEKKVVLD